MKRLVVLVLRLYKLIISPIIPPCCRFVPSCSEYASEAVSRYGVLKGGALSLKRLVRCQPFCPGGHDPVP